MTAPGPGGGDGYTEMEPGSGKPLGRDLPLIGVTDLICASLATGDLMDHTAVFQLSVYARGQGSERDRCLHSRAPFDRRSLDRDALFHANENQSEGNRLQREGGQWKESLHSLPEFHDLR